MDYSGWPAANQIPVAMDAKQAALCYQSLASLNSPHRQGNWIKVHVTPSGVSAMKSGKGPYPLGTVIVKEKRTGSPDSAPDGFTVMRKREKGYSPSGGDWEYAAYDAARGQIESGRLTRCMSCHQERAAQDYVFADYRDAAFLSGSNQLLPLEQNHQD